MFHTHIALVGGQPIPVYLGIVHTRPDKVLFICSNQSTEEATRIQRELKIDSKILIFNPVDSAAIHQKTEEVAKELNNHRVSLNISSGTKPWSYYFTHAFGESSNTEIFYVDQNNIVRNLRKYTQYGVDIDMDVRFRLYGNPLTEFVRLSDFTADDIVSIMRIRELRKFNFRDFNFLTELFSRNADRYFFESGNGSSLKWHSMDKKAIIKLYNSKGVLKSDIFDSSNVYRLLQNTGWFELEVAHLLSQWDKAKEIRLNCVFPVKQDSPKNKKNEIDIVVDTGSKLLFVECKTQIYRETDIDKFASAVKVYGGIGSKALFVTDAKMRDKAVEKCGDNKVISFSIQNNGECRYWKQSLFQLLDKELYNINLK